MKRCVLKQFMSEKSIYSLSELVCPVFLMVHPQTAVIKFETTSRPFFWYQESGLIMFENRFYYVGGCLASIHTKVLSTMGNMSPVPIASFHFNPDDDRVFPKKYMLSVVFPVDFEVSPYSYFSATSNKYCIEDPEFEHGIFFDRLTAPIKKIQRAMARYSRPRVQAKRLALSMSSHARLGEQSAISVLGLDLFRLIFSF